MANIPIKNEILRAAQSQDRDGSARDASSHPIAAGENPAQPPLVARLQDYAKDWRDRAASKEIVEEAIVEINRLQTENWQLKQACGYPIPADKETINNPFKCGICDARNREIPRAGAEPTTEPSHDEPRRPLAMVRRPNSQFDSGDGGQDWSIAESPKEALLSFIDAGADGDEPVKGVMQCNIREWFDEIDHLCRLSMALNRKLVLAESALQNIAALTGRHDLPDAQVIAIRALERDRTPPLTQPRSDTAAE